MISDSVPVQTPEPEPASSPPSITPTQRPRWLLPGAAAVVVLAAAIGLVAGLVLTNRNAGAGGAASYVPADSAIYYELRLDLPGDQRAALKSFLGHFPLLQVDKYLTDQLDQQLDELTKTMPSPAYRYSTDVKPWFDGRVGFALVRYPSMLPGTSNPVPDVLVLVGVKDATAAGAVSDRVRADLAKAGLKVTSTSHGGVTIWSAAAPSVDTPAGAPQNFAWAITADELIGGTSADLVGKALDSHSGAAPSLGSRDEFTAAVSRLPADRVLTASIDMKALLAGIQTDLASAQPSAAAVINQLAAQAPTFSVSSARFENDRFVVDTSGTLASSPPANTDRGLASLVPNDAIFFADGGQIGTGLANNITYLKGVIAASGGVGTQQLDQVEAALGGDLGSFVSWMGDTAVVGGYANGAPYVGLISEPTDAGIARTKLLQLQSLLQLASANGGPTVKISTADHGGTTITTISFDAGSSTPSWASSLQYAVTDQRVVIGSGDSFVARVLDMQAASSLGNSARFRAALDSVGGSSNTGAIWFDLVALRAALEPFVPADSKAVYETSIKPWVAPFDYLVAAGKADGQQLNSRIAVVVK